MLIAFDPADSDPGPWGLLILVVIGLVWFTVWAYRVIRDARAEQICRGHIAPKVPGARKRSDEPSIYDGFRGGR